MKWSTRGGRGGAGGELLAMLEEHEFIGVRRSRAITSNTRRQDRSPATSATPSRSPVRSR